MMEYDAKRESRNLERVLDTFYVWGWLSGISRTPSPSLAAGELALSRKAQRRHIFLTWEVGSTED
jgi:hypothetical protein